MITQIKLIAAGLVLVAAFFGGWYLGGSGKVETITETHTVKGDTVTVYRDRIVTVTKIVRPDGTVEETTKTEEKDKKKEEKIVDNNVKVTPNHPKWSLGYQAKLGGVEHSGSTGLPYPKLLHGITAGYHIGKDVWLKSGAIPSDNTYTIGLEIQF